MDKAPMASSIPTTVYCSVSKAGKVLYSYNGVDRELETLAALCLENALNFHSWYSHTVGNRTFGFLMDDGCIYFAIVDPCDSSASVHRFLRLFRDGFKKNSKNGLQDELFSIIHCLMVSLESVNDPVVSAEERPLEVWVSIDASPSTKVPLLGKHDKKGKMKERVVEVKDNEEEHVDRVRIDSSPEQPVHRFSLQKSASMRANGQRLWCRHVKIGAAIPLLVAVRHLACCLPSERYKIQQMITDFIKQKVSEMQTACMRSAFDPIFLYVLAPDLPKGALVEVKPVLHIPKNSEESVETNLQQAHDKKPHDRVLEYARWHGSCCQKYIVSKKMCAVLVSVTKDVAADICSENLQNAQGFEANRFVKDMKTIVKFCINPLDKILVENNFSWEDLKSLKVYFTTDLSTTVDVLSLTISEVLGEFAEVGKRAQGNGTIFNLIPVLGSGGSSSMDDLITYFTKFYYQEMSYTLTI